jgi:hypothetical protein
MRSGHRPLARLATMLALTLMCTYPALAQDAQTVPTLLPTVEDQSAADIAPIQPTWQGALNDSLRLLLIEHSTRIAFQDKTRRELGGPFFKDYVRSVKVPQTWEDGDSWAVNYVGHPIHGAAAGFIWLDHEDGAHDPELGFSRAYWASRGRATAWAAGYSLQFEFGPLSEASIGNVGMNPDTTGWVDHLVTPAGALGFMVAEDALDRYFIRRVERWTSNRPVRVVTRVLLNPSRSMSNFAQGQLPWYRAARPISSR